MRKLKKEFEMKLYCYSPKYGFKKQFEIHDIKIDGKFIIALNENKNHEIYWVGYLDENINFLSLNKLSEFQLNKIRNKSK